MIELQAYQDDFLYCQSTHTGMVGGFGSGKSFIGALKTLSKKLEYPNVDVAYYLPTYPLIRDVAFPLFKKLLDKQNIKYELNRSEKNFITPHGRIILRSMDTPDLIIGYEVGYSLIDEADALPINKMKEVFIRVLARNRSNLPNNEINSLDFVGTPEGFNFLYHFFVTNTNENKLLIKAKTEDNPHLPVSYIETLKQSYTKEQLQAYLNGEFINLKHGSVYYPFKRKLNHTDILYTENDLLHIGMDFNITNMSAVIHIEKDGFIYAVDEITSVYDTRSMIERLSQYKNTIYIYPDASGNQRQSNASYTDIELLRKAGHVVHARRSNPPVRDRINKLNGLILNAKGERKYFVNTNKCPKLTQALEQLSYTASGEVDKTSGHDHITDAAGYYVYHTLKQYTIGEVSLI